MFKFFSHWYQRRFSDPHAIGLMVWLLFGVIVIYFFGNLLAPLLVAIVLAYLLEWPVSYFCRLGIPRWLSVAGVLSSFISFMLMAFISLLPAIWEQISNLINDIPNMYTEAQTFLASLPERYPEVVNLNVVESLVSNMKNRALMLGESIIKGSLASLGSLAALAIYLIIVPLLLFFFLKDKNKMLDMVKEFLPRNRRLVIKVSEEMSLQIANYLRGKIIEILVVGISSYIAFFCFDLRYSLLLAVLVGFSVLIPYIGAAAVTVPILFIGLFQWGFNPTLYWLLLVHFIIQALDGNILVPILFSEAVNLHPVVIIFSVLIFGGLWGFWGVFFAIPLATLVKAVWNALPDGESEECLLS